VSHCSISVPITIPAFSIRNNPDLGRVYMVPLMRTLQSGRSALDKGRAAELFPTAAGQRHNERVDNMQGHHKPKPKAWVNYGDAAWRKTMDDVRDQCGRMDMRDSDHYGMEFQPIPLSEWSKRELKNRIAWLQKQRGQLIAKKEKLIENNRKLAKYTHELFIRESMASCDVAAIPSECTA
jgi:hypothetical protein